MSSININWPMVIGIGAPNIGAIVTGLITKNNLKWYEGIKKPEKRPPNWAFGPVWTYLYSSMGYASYVVYHEGGGFNGPAKLPLIVYGTNLAFNYMWTPLFFGAHRIKWALYEINAITLTAIASGYMFYKIKPVAGLLFIPYVAWLGIATWLNYRIVQDNPDEPKIKELKE